MKWDKGKIISGILLLFLILLFFTPIGVKLQSKYDEYTLPPAQTKKVSDMVFEPGDWQIPLKGYNGFSDTNLGNMKGEATLVNFWGTWCGPCVSEMPSLQKLYEAKGKEVNFAFVAINDKPEKINSFLKKYSYTFPVYDLESKFSKQIHPLTLPITYILNKKGEIVFMERGSADWNAQKVHQLLDSLILAD